MSSERDSLIYALSALLDALDRGNRADLLDAVERARAVLGRATKQEAPRA